MNLNQNTIILNKSLKLWSDLVIPPKDFVGLLIPYNDYYRDGLIKVTGVCINGEIFKNQEDIQYFIKNHDSILNFQ